MISSASSLRSRASSTLSPTCAISCGMPAAVPISSRPPVRWSSMPISSTTCQGCWYGSTTPITPSRIFLVRSATWAISRWGDGL